MNITRNNNNNRGLAGLLSTALLLVAGNASAQSKETGWYLELGPAHVEFSEAAKVAVAGNPIPNSDAILSNNQTVAAGLGYRFDNNFSVIGIIGVPPTTKLKGAGSLAGMDVGEVTYGPAIVTLNYHFPTTGAFKPYIGAGINYTIIFDTEDGNDISNFDADDTSGAVLRAGFEYRFHENHGLFVSANKIFISTTATGSVPAFGGAPVKADIDLDPLIIHAGWILRF
ncbi:OmpW family protein [Alteromonas sp. ZYF713]|nr:OmpW family protein [Alteromonas sp. ZYF713]